MDEMLAQSKRDAVNVRQVPSDWKGPVWDQRKARTSIRRNKHREKAVWLEKLRGHDGLVDCTQPNTRLNVERGYSENCGVFVMVWITTGSGTLRRPRSIPWRPRHCAFGHSIASCFPLTWIPSFGSWVSWDSVSHTSKHSTAVRASQHPSLAASPQVHPASFIHVYVRPQLVMDATMPLGWWMMDDGWMDAPQEIHGLVLPRESPGVPGEVGVTASRLHHAFGRPLFLWNNEIMK